MTTVSTPANRSDFGSSLGAALANGLGAVAWARREDQWPRVDADSGLVEDDVVLDALVAAIEALPGVRAVA